VKQTDNTHTKHPPSPAPARSLPRGFLYLLKRAKRFATRAKPAPARGPCPLEPPGLFNFRLNARKGGAGGPGGGGGKDRQIVPARGRALRWAAGGAAPGKALKTILPVAGTGSLIHQSHYIDSTLIVAVEQAIRIPAQRTVAVRFLHRGADSGNMHKRRIALSTRSMKSRDMAISRINPATGTPSSTNQPVFSGTPVVKSIRASAIKIKSSVRSRSFEIAFRISSRSSCGNQCI